LSAIDRLSVTVVVAAIAVMLVQTAAGGGEPKNEWPFTRPVAARAPQSAGAAASAATDVHGEPKNVWPFTRRVDSRSPQAAVARAIVITSPSRGEPKNEPPFVQATVSTAPTGEGFDWTDGGIGVLAGIGLALSAAGALLIVRKSPQTA
jgi:hypothetical protein